MRPGALLGLLLACLLAGCAAQSRLHAAQEPPAPLVLVSIDGFRADYLARGHTPTLLALARAGVRATAMQPSFPSLTFPNHYTLATGRVPDHHGIVHNTMEDPAIGRFSLGDRGAVADARWWNGATPIWVSADRAGLRTATMFWPGSEAPIQGLRPDYWRPYDASVTPLQRVDQVLAWLALPRAKRPTFLTLYFDSVDHQAHLHGPDAPEVDAALAEVDAALAHLREGLAVQGLAHRVNLVIVSDHGMAATPPGQVVLLDTIVSPDAARFVTLGAVAGLRPRPGHEAEVAAALARPRPHLACWPKAAIPARFRYGTHARVPPFVCLADVGWQLTTTRDLARRDEGHLGEHGYDNAAPEMQALFVANGPAFLPGTVLAGFPNVDVYPLLAHLLRIPAERNDGDLAPLRPALRGDR